LGSTTTALCQITFYWLLFISIQALALRGPTAPMISQTRVPAPVGLPSGVELIDWEVRSLVPELAKVKCGVVNLFLTGAAASGVALSVNENCDPTVRSDMLSALERLAPKSPAAKALLMSYPSLTLPVSDGRLSFGTWQGVYLACHGDGQSVGDLIVTVAEGSSQHGFTFDAASRASHAVDREVLQAVASDARTVPAGICLVHEKHTSASLGVSRGNLEPAMSRVVPEKWNSEFFKHTYEGPDDMPGHMKSTLLGCSASVPLSGGGLGLGSEQHILLHEHRNCGGCCGGHSRQLEVTVLGGKLAAVAQTPLEVPLAGPLTELTPALQDHLASSKLQGPGLLQVFVQGPTLGVLCAEEAACRSWLSAVAGIPGAAEDPAVQAALASPSLDIPFGGDGQLCLGPEQRVYVFTADLQGMDKASLLLTAQGSKL